MRESRDPTERTNGEIGGRRTVSWQNNTKQPQRSANMCVCARAKRNEKGAMRSDADGGWDTNGPFGPRAGEYVWKWVRARWCRVRAGRFRANFERSMWLGRSCALRVFVVCLYRASVRALFRLYSTSSDLTWLNMWNRFPQDGLPPKLLYRHSVWHVLIGNVIQDWNGFIFGSGNKFMLESVVGGVSLNWHTV